MGGDNRRRIEIYAPILVELLKCPDPAGFLQGETFILFLNPWSRPITEIDPMEFDASDSEEREIATEILRKRGDTDEEIEQRIGCLPEELEAWQAMRKMADTSPQLHFVDAVAWPHVEHTYRADFDGRAELAYETLVFLAEDKLPAPISEVFASFFSLKKMSSSCRKDACLEVWKNIGILLNRVELLRDGCIGSEKDHWNKVLEGLSVANRQCSIPFNLD